MTIAKHIFAALLATTMLPGTATAGPTDFGQGTQIGRVQLDAELTGDLKSLYAQFKREARYFAAMAVNFDQGYGFYLQNFHSAGSARAAALEGCRSFTQDDGCVIYAVAMPESLPVDQSRAIGFSEWAADDFNTIYLENRKPGTYGAFALSGASHHGHSYGYPTEADARDSAIAYCKITLAKDMADIGPSARKFARARGWQNCKVVDVNYTPAD